MSIYFKGADDHSCLMLFTQAIAIVNSQEVLVITWIGVHQYTPIF